MASLSFLGAAQQVTGSCYLLRTEHGNLLLECGFAKKEMTTENGS
jgi:metallo-beta-lactamase family protein